MHSEISQTALTAAAARAAHPLVDAEPPIFTDPLAAPLLGAQAEEFLRYHREHGAHPILAAARAQVVIRSRYTEDRLAEAVRSGVTQYVLLGAGLDSFAYRNPLPVRVFEVDHPATQEGKRARLAAAGTPVPETVSYAPVDFEAGSLTASLRAAGFDPARPAFIAWLGVTVYLTPGSIRRTLAALGTFAPGSQLVADYLVPESLRDETGSAYARGVGGVAAERGEPWLSFFTPGEMAELLSEHGFRVLDDAGQREAIAPGLWRRTDSLSPGSLSRLVHAGN
ncbi:class I SAM-dependent methyltransferase [Amycolatopsis rhizosphaerae]|uniref:S-adenosyl-L-methionine-dependent methyltransferase n=1 Tax=Amycolatopsis rhizosphaerae TaxID=2053003 RepID=A0A558D184_9PSEU|nr:class I SAM-dependent methyltransferase [Amycolatopsis rhizosphaerae]TVT54781.1 class I SAM-dependent methyltransferase [Amycolatopsis rhizosphaerae]